MVTAWINLSTRWGLTSVQATLNVVISILGTVGIWSFSRYWWQQGSTKVLHGNHNVPFSVLYTLAGPGEGWDVVTVLRRRVFAKENWCLLFQLVVVIAATLACMLSGPIAKVSLRRTRIVQTSKLGVLQTMKGGGSGGNLVDANVPWNDTIFSLNQAGFPGNQLLDYLPPSTVDWIYVASEWDPTWSMSCSYTPETILQNVTGIGNFNFYDPVNAFPAYRDTYDPSWLNTSKYRMQADFHAWTIMTGQPDPPFKDAMYFVLFQSDPEIDDRMDTNNETLQISISVFHAQGFHALDMEDPTDSGATVWRPFGPVANASFARVECSITRKPEVPDENAIPWVWTNDTYSITLAYRTYWGYQMDNEDSKNLFVPTPTSDFLLRFYQAYMVTVNTMQAFPTPRKVSIWKDTVQLSIVFLIVVIVLTCLTLYQTGRYFWFMRRNKDKLEQICVPDSKMEWMVHAAKTSTLGEEEKLFEGKRVKDRDHFRAASFGYCNTNFDAEDPSVQPPKLARVFSSRTSISGTEPTSIRGSLSRGGSHHCPPLTVSEEKDEGHLDRDIGLDRKRTQSSADSQKELELVISSANEKAQSSLPDDHPHPDRKMLNPQFPGKLSRGGSRASANSGTGSSRCSSLSIVPETVNTQTANDTAGS